MTMDGRDGPPKTRWVRVIQCSAEIGTQGGVLHARIIAVTFVVGRRGAGFSAVKRRPSCANGGRRRTGSSTEKSPRERRRRGEGESSLAVVAFRS